MFLKDRVDEFYPMDINSDDSKLRYDNDVNPYWFRRLDFLLWLKHYIKMKNDSKSESKIDKEVIKSFKFRRGGRSIEHLHPQNEAENEEWKDAENIHSFGNLALISKSFNSEQSNDTLDVKFARIKRQIETRQIQSIKLYLMYLLSDSNGANWTEEKMLEHEGLVIDIIKNSND